MNKTYPFLLSALLVGLLTLSLPVSAQQASAKQATKPQSNDLDMESSMVRVLEEQLTRWKPTEKNASLSDKTLLSPQTNIVGTWQVSRGYDGSTLVIKRAKEDVYTVEFSTAGCLGNWSLKRTARYANGILLLDRPVEEYFPLTYRRLYAVRVGKTEYLVSDAAITKFQQGLSADKQSIDSLKARFYSFTKEALSPVTGVATAKGLNQKNSSR